MKNFTKEELQLLFNIINLAKKKKTASKPANIIAEAGYTKEPAELESVYKKLSTMLYGEEKTMKFWVLTDKTFMETYTNFFKEGKETPTKINAAWPSEEILKIRKKPKSGDVIVELESKAYMKTRGIDQWKLAPGAITIRIYELS